MKTIIVATDFSSEASNAMEYAAELARYTRARLILFNSYQLPEHGSQGERLSPAEVEYKMLENRKYLERIAAKVSLQFRIKVDCWTNLTYVAEGLDELVQKHQADLVVMGMWRNSREDTLFGNTTTFVISHATYPVLVIPEGLHFKKINRIMFSWDPGSLSPSNTLPLLKDMASHFRAEVQVFHVEQELELDTISPTKRKAPFGEMLQGVQHAFRSLEDDDIVEGIERGLREYKPDLLVMVPHKPGLSDAFFSESRTREMALRTRVPLLAIPDKH